MSSSLAAGLSHYHIERRLGAGGMGEVFLALDTRLERQVALKILSTELARDPHQRKRFHTEAKAASALAHPHICVIHEVGETEDGRPFLAMEYVAGQTLHDLLCRRRLSIPEALRIGLGVAEALTAAHERGVIHRDIKPANIMVDARGNPKVLDFGLAKVVGRGELGAEATSAALTRTGSVLGSPFYMSPEQALGRDLDARTDIFSLGAILYELLAGQRPFLGRTVGEAINNVINHQPGPLELKDPVYSPGLDRIVFKCLEKDPANRYASARELTEDLNTVRLEAERSALQAMPAVPRQPPSSSHGGEQGKRNGGATDGVRAAVNRPKRARWIAAAAACLVLAAGLAWWLVRPGWTARRGGAASAEKSIAVLPFANISPEPDTDYLSDGMTEEITSALSRIPGLKVAARNSAYAFKGKKGDDPSVGKTLRVNTLLEGSVQKVDKQIRVTARLINVKEGYLIWSETYNRPLDDILKVQQEIALQIARRLETPTEPVTARRNPGPEAYRYYLLARQAWNKRTEAGLTNAIELFKRVIEKDPKYPEAHAGLAASYLLLPNYSTARHTKYSPLARAEANLALELDPTCAEAHAVLGQLHWMAHDLKGAERHFRRALDLDSNYATARHWYGQFLAVHGRPQEGLAQLETAVSLDPLSPVIRTSVAEWYHLTGEVDRAIQESRSVVAAFPDFPLARMMLGYSLVRKGLFDDALAQLDTARALEPSNPLAYLELKAFALARSGRETEARKILSLFEQSRDQGKVLDGALSFIYLGLRDYEKSIDALESLAAAEGLQDALLCDPFFRELQPFPRFQGLLQRMGLAEGEAIKL